MNSIDSLKYIFIDVPHKHILSCAAAAASFFHVTDSSNCYLFIALLINFYCWSIFSCINLFQGAPYNLFPPSLPFLVFFFYNSLCIFPQAGPDIKYLLGFVRTQLSTTTTIFLVFGPKILRVLRGEGDKWDNRSRARGITASFCINGGGLMPEEGVDLYQENEELKVIIKLYLNLKQLKSFYISTPHT